MPELHLCHLLINNYLEIQIQLTKRSLDNLLDLNDGSPEILKVNIDSSSYLKEQD